MIKAIFTLIILIFFSGCSIFNKNLNSNKNVYKSKKLKELTKQLNDKPTYIKEAKFIKILILPFQNTKNDIDYGGYYEFKLRDSEIIVNQRDLKKLKKSNFFIMGSIND